VIGFVLALVLLALAVALVPLRFTRAVRRGLRDPEFRSLFGLVVLTLAAGTVFYRDVEGWSLLRACTPTSSTPGTSSRSKTWWTAVSTQPRSRL
jgi:hypothetical protein